MIVHYNMVLRHNMRHNMRNQLQWFILKFDYSLTHFDHILTNFDSTWGLGPDLT